MTKDAAYDQRFLANYTITAKKDFDKWGKFVKKKTWKHGLGCSSSTGKRAWLKKKHKQFT